jgi:VanZ family protein
MSVAALPPVLERTLRILPAILYMTFTWLISAQSAESLPANVSDRVAHFGEYALLALLLVFAFTGFDAARVTPAVLLSAAVLSIVWGVIDEYHQSFVPTRDASLRDVISDAAGTAGGVALVAVLAWRERRRA